MSYRVLITPTARALMLEQARYIAVDCQAPENAARWLEGVFDAAETLAEMPYRCARLRRTSSATTKSAAC